MDAVEDFLELIENPKLSEILSQVSQMGHRVLYPNLMIMAFMVSLDDGLGVGRIWISL